MYTHRLLSYFMFTVRIMCVHVYKVLPIIGSFYLSPISNSSTVPVSLVFLSLGIRHNTRKQRQYGEEPIIIITISDVIPASMRPLSTAEWIDIKSNLSIMEVVELSFSRNYCSDYQLYPHEEDTHAPKTILLLFTFAINIHKLPHLYMQGAACIYALFSFPCILESHEEKTKWAFIV